MTEEVLTPITREVGKYTAPVETRIGEIPTVIVDPHNEVFGYWFNQFYGRKPAVLIHVDSHADDNYDFAKSDEELMRHTCVGSYPHKYAINNLEIANFIAPAFFYGLVSKFYWVKTRTHKDEYNSNVPVEAIDSTWLFVENFNRILSNKHRSLPLIREAYEGGESLSRTRKPIILDIDLDALSLYNGPFMEDSDIGDDIPERIATRVYRTANFLKGLPRPELITIARSQTPKTYVKPGIVDFVQEELLRGLNKIYSEARAA